VKTEAGRFLGSLFLRLPVGFIPRAGISKTFRESEPPCDPSADAGPSRTLPTSTARLTPREGSDRPDRRSARSLAWFRNGSFRVTLGSFSVGRDRSRVVAGLCEAGRSRSAGVTDPGYNLAVLLRFEPGSFSLSRASESIINGTTRNRSRPRPLCPKRTRKKQLGFLPGRASTARARRRSKRKEQRAKPSRRCAR
jgi:hypothetical protein